MKWRMMWFRDLRNIAEIGRGRFRGFGGMGLFFFISKEVKSRSSKFLVYILFGTVSILCRVFYGILGVFL